MYATPYLFFNGNCAEALRYYEKVLGAQIGALMKYGDSPAAEHVPAEFKDKVIHARLHIGPTVILFSDSHVASETKPGGYSMTLHVDTPEVARKTFDALADGGKVGMALDKTFFAAAFGQLVDRFGIHWMIICEKSAA